MRDNYEKPGRSLFHILQTQIIINAVTFCAICWKKNVAAGFSQLDVWGWTIWICESNKKTRHITQWHIPTGKLRSGLHVCS